MRALYRPLEEYNGLRYILRSSCILRKFPFATERFAIIIYVPLLNV